MSRLFVVALFLASTATAMYREPPATTAMRVNIRQRDLFNAGEYETLVKELYLPYASIFIQGNLKAIASGHDEIIATLKKQAGYKINNMKIDLENVDENSGVFSARVSHTVTTANGQEAFYKYQQAFYQGKIALVIAEIEK